MLLFHLFRSRSPCPSSFISEGFYRIDIIAPLNVWLNFPVKPSEPEFSFVGRFLTVSIFKMSGMIWVLYFSLNEFGSL